MRWSRQATSAERSTCHARARVCVCVCVCGSILFHRTSFSLVSSRTSRIFCGLHPQNPQSLANLVCCTVPLRAWSMQPSPPILPSGHAPLPRKRSRTGFDRCTDSLPCLRCASSVALTARLLWHCSVQTHRSEAERDRARRFAPVQGGTPAVVRLRAGRVVPVGDGSTVQSHSRRCGRVRGHVERGIGGRLPQGELGQGLRVQQG